MYNLNDKYFIVDENKEIITSSNNLLQLRIDCKEMNEKIGGECEVLSKNELGVSYGDN